MEAPLFDVLIIGGGLAGLSAALSLVRSRHSAVVFDAGGYRNARASWLHTLPAFDSRDPADHRAATRANILAKYSSVQFADGVRIAAVDRLPAPAPGAAAFRATDDRGRQWRGRKLVLATGIADLPLDIPGYDECWTRGIFHCLVHRGYEETGCASAGVLGIGGDENLKALSHLAAQCPRYTDGPVTVYTHANTALTTACRDALEPLGVRVEDRLIVRLVKEPVRAQVTVEFADGDRRTEGFLVHRPLPRNNGAFADQLGVETNEFGFYKTNPPFFETSVPGVFAAGDCADPFKIGSYALAMGAFVAGGLQMQLDMGARAAGPAMQIVRDV